MHSVVNVKYFNAVLIYSWYIHGVHDLLLFFFAHENTFRKVNSVTMIAQFKDNSKATTAHTSSPFSDRLSWIR